MARLIDADVLERKWQDVLDEKAHEKGTVGYTVFELFIERLKGEPTVEAKPVVHGEWIVLGQRTYGSGGGRNYTHYCSECGQHGFEDYKLCPNCGADMRERKADGE